MKRLQVNAEGIDSSGKKVVVSGSAGVRTMATLSPDKLNTLINLLLSPLLVMAGLTTFIVGLSVFVSWLRHGQQGGVEVHMAAAVNYAIARAFVVSIAPSAFVLLSTLHVYHVRVF